MPALGLGLVDAVVSLKRVFPGPVTSFGLNIGFSSCLGMNRRSTQPGHGPRVMKAAEPTALVNILHTRDTGGLAVGSLG